LLRIPFQRRADAPFRLSSVASTPRSSFSTAAPHEGAWTGVGARLCRLHNSLVGGIIQPHSSHCFSLLWLFSSSSSNFLCAEQMLNGRGVLLRTGWTADWE
jgi:hypothetical protein